MAKRALIVIDLQNDYFSGGKWTLHNIDQAADNAASVLKAARASDDLIVHVHHEFEIDEPPFFEHGTTGAEFHESVFPKEDEATVLKHHINSFRDTRLKEILDEHKVEDVTLVGAMSHMCIDAATRAAADYGYNVTVVEDACASRDLEFGGEVVAATDVHAAYMSALSFAYAKVSNTRDYLA